MQKPRAVLFNKKYITKPVKKHLSLNVKYNEGAAKISGSLSVLVCKCE